MWRERFFQFSEETGTIQFDEEHGTICPGAYEKVQVVNVQFCTHLPKVCQAMSTLCYTANPKSRWCLVILYHNLDVS